MIRYDVMGSALGDELEKIARQPGLAREVWNVISPKQVLKRTREQMPSKQELRQAVLGSRARPQAAVKSAKPRAPSIDETLPRPVKGMLDYGQML